ncbi:MAG: response regulator, partial [Chloroflexi bacterium]
MNHYAILLIEDQITITAQIVTELGRQLDHYRLSITRSVDEAEREHAPADVILLNLNLLGNDAAGPLERLSRLYPDAPIVLLAEGLAGTDENLQRALAAGAVDFVPVSPAGLLVLGRRLAGLQQAAQSSPVIGPSLFRQINRDKSDLAFQVIGRDNRVKAWNKTAESLFGIAQADALDRRVDELPLHAADLSRLKDVLDHARAVQQPFVIPQYSLGNLPDSWLLVHVYPIRHHFPDSDGTIDICIVATQVMEQTHAISQNDLQINQDLRILLEANRAISGQLDLQTVLEKVIEQGKSLMFGDNCQIYLLEKDNKTLKPVLAVGPLANEISQVTLTVGSGVFGKAVTHGHATAINSTVDCPGIPYAADERLLCGPLTAAKGTIGLMVVSRRYSDFSQDDIHFFESLVQ